MLVDIDIRQIEQNVERGLNLCASPMETFDDVLCVGHTVYLSLYGQMVDVLSAETFERIGHQC